MMHPSKNIMNSLELRALELARNGNLEECIDTIKKIEPHLMRKKTAKKVTDIFAAHGNFEASKRIIPLEFEGMNLLSNKRTSNSELKRLSSIFADHNFFDQAEACINSITMDWDKSTDFEFAPMLKKSAYSALVRKLIYQKEFKRAQDHLLKVEDDDYKFFEEKILRGLGKWKEPKSSSKKRYLLIKPSREVTIEELTREFIHLYVEKRVDKETDFSDMPEGDSFGPNSDEFEAWRKRKREEVKERKCSLLKEFYTLDAVSQIKLLRKYIKVDVHDMEWDQLKDVMEYLINR